ncbi:hypothetical protein BpHYR1_049645 [Brachionus plicatilis]|uniref:Uncharacterized protein n=1 Tax=Brachionus plicatilis TaxID=10195 RepID=A0A3M7R696_BRAPC|nr:hypothetical protein BpHYR1_049645 [Brachionus plicatilis]
MILLLLNDLKFKKNPTFGINFVIMTLTLCFSRSLLEFPVLTSGLVKVYNSQKGTVFPQIKESSVIKKNKKKHVLHEKLLKNNSNKDKFLTQKLTISVNQKAKFLSMTTLRPYRPNYEILKKNY